MLWFNNIICSICLISFISFAHFKPEDTTVVKACLIIGAFLTGLVNVSVVYDRKE